MAFDLVLRDVDHPDAATRAVISVASKRNRTFDELHRLRKRHVRLVVSIKVAPDECATRAGHGPVTLERIAVAGAENAILAGQVAAEDDMAAVTGEADAGVDFGRVETSVAPQVLVGKAVVVTGSIEGYSREEAEAAIKARGGKSPGSVSAKTTCVVVGEAPGASKVTKANELGIPIVPAERFTALLETGSIS